MKFVQLAKSLQTELAPVYLVEGEEAYFRDHAVKSIRTACRLTQSALNDVRYEGETLKGEKLASFLSEISTLPFFDEKRIARVYEFYPTEKEWETYLEKYCSRPAPATVLIIVNAGKKGNDMKKKKGVTFVDCSRESEEMLTRWLYQMMTKEGLAPAVDACEKMVRYCNNDAARMKRETEKLALLLGAGGKVTNDVVEAQISKDVEYKIYELTQAASRGNFSQFNEILSDLMKKGFDENAVVASLTSHYRTLCEIATMDASDGEIAAALGVKPYAVQKNREIVKRLGKEKVRAFYSALYELSCGMKNGTYTKSGALFAALAKIFFD